MQNFHFCINHFGQAQVFGKVDDLVDLGIDHLMVTARQSKANLSPLVNVIYTHFGNGCIEMSANLLCIVHAG